MQKIEVRKTIIEEIIIDVICDVARKIFPKDGASDLIEKKCLVEIKLKIWSQIKYDRRGGSETFNHGPSCQ